MNSKSSYTMIAGALGGVTLGWFFRSFNHKRKQLEGYESFLDKAKNLEKKIYEDGKKRADQIDGIKQEVNKKVSQ